MNSQLISYDDLVVWLGLDPESKDTKPHVVRQLLEKSGVVYVRGKGNRPCATIQALTNAKVDEDEIVSSESNSIEVVKLD